MSHLGSRAESTGGCVKLYPPVQECDYCTHQYMGIITVPTSTRVWALYRSVQGCDHCTHQYRGVITGPTSTRVWSLYLPVQGCDHCTHQYRGMITVPTSTRVWSLYPPVHRCDHRTHQYKGTAVTSTVAHNYGPQKPFRILNTILGRVFFTLGVCWGSLCSLFDDLSFLWAIWFVW